jgi:rhodanese-related sulfurtransferase
LETILLQTQKKFDKTKPVLCKSGNRSKKATEKLNELGFKNIYELDGGFMKWSDEGLNNAKE